MKEPLINMELIIFVEEICRNLQDPVKWKQKLAKTSAHFLMQTIRRKEMTRKKINWTYPAPEYFCSLFLMTFIAKTFGHLLNERRLIFGTFFQLHVSMTSESQFLAIPIDEQSRVWQNLFTRLRKTSNSRIQFSLESWCIIRDSRKKAIIRKLFSALRTMNHEWIKSMIVQYGLFIFPQKGFKSSRLRFVCRICCRVVSFEKSTTLL